jgi:hypothetical protein
MKGPLIFAQMAHGAPVQPEAFADPYTSGTHQKQGVCEKVIDFAQMGG